MLRFSRSLILHNLEDIKTQHLFIHYLQRSFLPLGLFLLFVGILFLTFLGISTISFALTSFPLLPCKFQASLASWLSCVFMFHCYFIKKKLQLYETKGMGCNSQAQDLTFLIVSASTLQELISSFL